MDMAGTSGATGDKTTPVLANTGKDLSQAPAALFANTPRPRLSPPARRAAILIFGLFGTLTATDAILSEMDAAAKVQSAAHQAASMLDNVAVDAAEDAFTPIAKMLDANLWAWVTDRDGNLIISDMDASAAPLAGLLPDTADKRAIAGPLGEVEIGTEQASILAPVGWRGLLGLALATLFTLGAGRWLGGSKTEARARTLRNAMASGTDGMAIWDSSQKLLAINEHLGDTGLVPPALMRRGTNYGAFLDGLRLVGELTLLRTDRRGRRLRLARPDDSAWEIREDLTEDGLLITRIIDDTERSRLRNEVVHLRSRIGDMAEELRTQRVRGDAASRSKTLFLSHLSHSLRTPLNHIIGFADLLRHQSYGPLGDARYLNYAANIKQSGEALLDMLSSTLELAEFDSGQRVLAKEQIQLAELFDWTEGRYRDQAKRVGIDIFVERQDDIIVVGDRLGLRRMIGSIIDNCLKFTPSGGSVTLAAWRSEDGVVLEFTDTGIGIPSDTLTVLNTSFALSNDSRGNGIAIARAIAELSGGQLQINSSPGIGTTVAVALPALSVYKNKLHVHHVA